MIAFFFLLRVAKTKKYKPVKGIKSPFLFRQSKSKKKKKQMHAKNISTGYDGYDFFTLMAQK